MTLALGDRVEMVLRDIEDLLATETNRARYVRLIRIREAVMALVDAQH